MSGLGRFVREEAQSCEISLVEDKTPELLGSLELIEE